MWSRSKPSCDMLLTERKQLKSIPGCGGLTSTTWNGVNGVRGLKQKCLPLGGGGVWKFRIVFLPNTKHCNFTGTVLWYYHRACVITLAANNEHKTTIFSFFV